MKILHIIPNYIPLGRSAGPVLPTHFLNKSLVKLGEDVTVYTTNTDGSVVFRDVPLMKKVLCDGVKIIYFPISFPKTWMYSKDFVGELRKNIANFDIVHITSVFLAFSTIGARIAKQFNKPYIISPHGSLMKIPLTRRALKKSIYMNLVEKKNLLGASAIHFLVDKEEREYKDLDIPLRRSIIIPNGIDLNEFSANSPQGSFKNRFGIAQDKNIILFLGRIHKIKGLDTLIPALSRVVKEYSNTVLVIAGSDDGYKAEVLRFIEKFKLKDFVIFTGPIFGKDKIAALSESKIFVLPSYTESCSMSTAEALYFSIPTIITDTSGLSSEISGAEAGIIVKKNEDDLAQAILKVLKEPEFAVSISRKAHEFAIKKFSIDSIANRFLAEYNEIISEYLR